MRHLIKLGYKNGLLESTLLVTPILKPFDIHSILYGLIIFEDKGHIGKIAAACKIRPKPPLIPGINHSCI